MAVELVAETTTGHLRGRERDGALLFAGVPYAAPPVGPLRFRAPVVHAGWAGEREATRFGRVAPQVGGTMARLTGAPEPDCDEDCLTLNVQTPALDDRRRPVLFWIHGGGFYWGSGSTPWYDGARFVARGDVVVVTINYRLGALGWLHLGDLDPSFAGSGNCGLLDQIAALTWVRDNIAAFGGDPSNVTLFGQSAGAMSVATLLGTPRAAGLFRRAILQSGGASHVSEAPDATEVTTRVLRTLDLARVADLVSTPWQRLLEAQQRVLAEIAAQRALRDGLGMAFCPVVDGSVVKRQPMDEIRDGLSARIPVLTGTTRDEWNLFARLLSPVDDETTLRHRLRLVVEDPTRLIDAYRASRQVEGGRTDPHELWLAVLTDRAFRLPAIRLAEAQGAHQLTTYMYLFEYASTAFDGKLGSCHCLDIPFVFDNLHKPGVRLFAGEDAPQALADAVHASWLAFATTGNPTHDGIPAWPAYQPGGRTTMHFGDQVHVQHDPSAAERTVWDGVL